MALLNAVVRIEVTTNQNIFFQLDVRRSSSFRKRSSRSLCHSKTMCTLIGPTALLGALSPSRASSSPASSSTPTAKWEGTRCVHVLYLVRKSQFFDSFDSLKIVSCTGPEIFDESHRPLGTGSSEGPHWPLRCSEAGGGEDGGRISVVLRSDSSHERGRRKHDWTSLLREWQREERTDEQSHSSGIDEQIRADGFGGFVSGQRVKQRER